MKTIYKKLLLFVFLFPFAALAQSTLDGKVVDKVSKQPIPGVNVVVQGAANSTQTDFDGKFRLVKIKKGDKILVSYIGYNSVTVPYTGQTELTVSLEESSNQLQEVVIQVGYGSVRKKDATGSLELITSKDFNKGAITSVDGLINGRASGVVVTSSGTPGNGATIRIRGGSSLLANNDPLIVIDGLPTDGGLTSVNPNDIESFSILKDASSTAIYGNRGSNGVILITTKKGSKKELEVNLNTFTSANTLAKKIDVYSADEFRSLINSKFPTKVGLLGNAKTDWQEEIFETSFTSDLNLSILGNLFGKVPARLTIGNTDNNGILLTSEFKRTTGSFSLNPSFFDNHLKFNITGTYSYTYKRDADEGAIGSAISYDPTQTVFDQNSIFAGYTEQIDSNGIPRGTSNPLALLYERRNITNNKRFFGNFNLEYKFHFLPDLKAIINLGTDKEEGTSFNRTNPLSRSGFNTTLGTGAGNTLADGQVGYYGETWFDNRNQNLNMQLNYSKKIKKFNVDVLGGYEWQQFDFQNFKSGNINLYSYPNLNEIVNRDVYTDPGNNLQAYFSRLNLGYNDKYLLTVNFRRDGSSKVSPINKWDNFMGFALAWKVNEESFLKNSNVFSDLKLRLSYGETGQQAISDQIAWFKRYSVSNNAYYQFGNEFFLVAKPEGYNENLKWERSAKYNIGLDFGFFNNRLKGNIDGYYSKTNDLFAYTVQGALQNLGIYGPRNIGELVSKGIDIGLNVEAIKKENFELNFNYNATFNKLELTDVFVDNQTTGGIGLQLFTQIYKVGLAPNAFWVYQQIYDTNGRPIEGAYVDRDGNGVIDSNDKYNYKKPQADVTMGFLTNATIFKNWDFSMAWRASIGNYVYDQVSSGRANLSAVYNSFTETISNTTTDYGDTQFVTGANRESDYYVKDGSFLKLDNITIGHNFKKLLNNDKTSLRLYTGVQNVLIITKYKGIDPEVFNNGIDNTIFPRARIFMLGVNANF